MCKPDNLGWTTLRDYPLNRDCDLGVAIYANVNLESKRSARLPDAGKTGVLFKRRTAGPGDRL